MKSLLTRSMMAVTAVVIPVVIATTLLMHAHLATQVNKRFDGRLLTETRMIEAAVHHAEHTGNQDGLKAIAQLLPLDSIPGEKTFAIWINGRLWTAGKGFPLQAAPLQHGFFTADTDSGQWRIYAEQPAPEPNSTTAMVVAVAEPVPSRLLTIKEIFVDMAWPLTLTFPLAVLGIYVALRRSLAPIGLLAEQIQQRSAEQRNPICMDQVPGEMSPIVESVNSLMSRIGDSLEREQRFTADAAHELRTPLTALKTHAQVALQTHDDQQRRTTLHKIVVTVNRTNRLISQLLTLAQLDPQAPRLDAGEVDLASVARETLADLSGGAEARNQRLHLQADTVLIRGERATLGLLMRNIVENAIHYSTQGESIDIRVYRRGAHGILEVEDRGPGIPDAEKTRAFRRFWRIPGTQGFGTGLGLSIVQRVIELHGGEISLRDGRDGIGLCVAASFPAN